MATKLEKLTPEQETQIPVISDEFLRYGLSTDPADFEALWFPASGPVS